MRAQENIEKKRARQVRFLRARRESFLAGKVCARCSHPGSSEVPLEIDHIDPATKTQSLKAGVNMWSWSRVRLEAELAKCQVLCKRCHDEKTDSDLGQRRDSHGRRRMYMRGCRCADCRSAESAYQLARRNARREAA